MSDFKKKEITSEEMGQVLWLYCKKFSKEFYKDKDFRTSVEKRGFELHKEADIIFLKEITIMNLWIISKTLSPDKKVLDVLHKIYFSGHANFGETEEEKSNFPKQAEAEIKERYEKYYEANDEKSEMQIVLAMTILEYLLNNGKPDRRLVDIRLTWGVVTHMLSMMIALLEFRKDLVIKDRT